MEELGFEHRQLAPNGLHIFKQCWDFTLHNINFFHVFDYVLKYIWQLHIFCHLSPQYKSKCSKYWTFSCFHSSPIMNHRGTSLYINLRKHLSLFTWVQFLEVTSLGQRVGTYFTSLRHLLISSINTVAFHPLSAVYCVYFLPRKDDVAETSLSCRLRNSRKSSGLNFCFCFILINRFFLSSMKFIEK